MINTNESNFKYRCVLCNKKFKSKVGLSSHVRKKHHIKIDDYNLLIGNIKLCEVCGKRIPLHYLYPTCYEHKRWGTVSLTGAEKLAIEKKENCILINRPINQHILRKRNLRSNRGDIKKNYKELLNKRKEVRKQFVKDGTVPDCIEKIDENGIVKQMYMGSEIKVNIRDFWSGPIL